MKKLLALILVLVVIMAISAMPVYAAGQVVGTVNANKNFSGSADYYGHVFENLQPGIYKIGYYFKVDNFSSGKQVRISPRVQSTTVQPNERRCWFDFRFTPAVTEAYQKSGKNKILMVVVLNVPEGYTKIDAGFWQDDQTIVGTLEKVVLATHDYNFWNKDYFLMGEINYRMQMEGDGDHSNTSFGEDPGAQLLAPAGSWVPSAQPDDSGEQPKPTGDASMVLTMLVAGAAAFGALKLRKK